MPEDRAQSIPEPPRGTPAEVARRAWQVAWSASNAVAEYHASVVKHFADHEEKVLAELGGIRDDMARDFADFKTALVTALAAVGVHITLPGEHPPAPRLPLLEEGSRERVASSHDLEEGLAKVGEDIEDRFRELSSELRQPGERPSERIRELLSQERARQEADAKILRLELEKKTLELGHEQELRRLGDQKREAESANARWQRIAFLIGGGIVTVLAGLLVWALTKQPAALGHG